MSGSDITSPEPENFNMEKSASMSQLTSPTNGTAVFTSQFNNVALSQTTSRGSTASPNRNSMISESSFFVEGHDEFKVDLG